ncbi:MAG: hypothetical protein IJ757_04580 [Clostridiales bacterium]|nr:hypothetical protein [Clostridiales bacterium]
MKKSEIRLIICGIASLVISVLLGIATVIVFIANVGSSVDTEKIQNSFASFRDSVVEMTDNVTDGVSQAEDAFDTLSTELDELDL